MQHHRQTSYCTSPYFVQPAEAQKRGALQLVDAMRVASTSAMPGLNSPEVGVVGNPVPMPPGFLEDFAVKQAPPEGEGLQQIMDIVGEFETTSPTAGVLKAAGIVLILPEAYSSVSLPGFCPAAMCNTLDTCLTADSLRLQPLPLCDPWPRCPHWAAMRPPCSSSSSWSV